mmetsp:Transcript_17157/g.55113  ORF Transcript_17157/g.55113 Transcript_17157/m.55113 type:complete len:599 (+) Transcript_17157:1267-3063(+)
MRGWSLCPPDDATMEESAPLVTPQTSGLRRLWSRMSRTKTVEEVMADHDASLDGMGEASLHRALTAWDLIAYGLGSTLGAGIYVTVGVAANEDAGPGVMFSFMLASLACMFSAFCYAEFASRVPVSGSAYTFAYTCLGEGVAWFISWNLLLEYGISASAVARGWASYVAALMDNLGAPLPHWLYDWHVGPFSLSPLAVVIVAVCTVVLVGGVKESARLNLIMTGINVAIIGFIIIVGSFHVHSDNLTPVVREDKGVSGIVSAAGIVFFSYIGFDAVSTLAGEVRNPQRDLPIGILGTLAGATVLYVAVSLILTGMVPYHLIDENSPLTQAFNYAGVRWAGTVVAMGSVTTLSATTLCSLFGQPRIFYSMAKDGLLGSAFAKLNNKQVPVFGTVLTGVTSAMICFVLDIGQLTNMISIGTLLAFGTVCASVVLLRFVAPGTRVRATGLLILFSVVTVVSSLLPRFVHGWAQYVSIAVSVVVLLAIVAMLWRMPMAVLDAPFHSPLVPLFPCLGLYFNIHLICGLDFPAIIRLVVWTIIGFVIYFMYGISHSAMEQRARIEKGASASTSSYSPSLTSPLGPGSPSNTAHLITPPTPQLRY